jgi:hypothetical protein
VGGSIRNFRDRFVAGDGARIIASAHCRLQRNVEVDDFQLMLDEGTAGLAILAAPFEIGEGDATAFQQTRATITGTQRDVRVSGQGAISAAERCVRKHFAPVSRG